MLEGMSSSSLWKLIKDTDKRVPPVRYVMGVVACAAGAAIIKNIGLTDGNASFPILTISAVIAFVIILYVLSIFLKSKDKGVYIAGLILIYGVLALALSMGTLVLFCVFFDYPKPFKDIVSSQRTSINIKPDSLTIVSAEDSTSKFTPLFSAEPNDSVLRIIILPMHPDEKCNLQQTDYDRNIMAKFERMKHEGLEVSAIYDSSLICPYDEQARLYAKTNNADAILYGYYDEQCSDFSKRVKFKFAIVCENLTHQSLYESKYQSVKHVEELANGLHDPMVEGLSCFLIAQKLFRKSEYQKALEHLEGIKNGDHYDFFLFLKVACLQKLNRPREIIRLSKNITRYCHNGNGDVLLGNAYAAVGDSVNAMTHYTSAIELFPDSLKAIAYAERGELNFTHNLPQAVSDFTAAIKGYHNFDSYYMRELHLRALAHAALGEYASSIIDLNELLRYDSQNCRYLVEIANCYNVVFKFSSNDEYKLMANLYFKKASELNCQGDTFITKYPGSEIEK